MKLTLVVGPMFAGKTTFIINQYKINEKSKTIAVKPILDNRYATEHIVSHDKETIPCISLNKLKDLGKEVELEIYNNILVDEGQFFPDIEEFISEMEDYEINIFIAALNGDFKRKPLGQIYNLYSRADEIIYKQGSCSYCDNKSSFSWKKTLSNSQVEIGGEDLYQAVCGSCYQKLLKGFSSQTFLSEEL